MVQVIPGSLRGRPRPLFGPDEATAAAAAAASVSGTIFRGRPRPRLGPSVVGLGAEPSGYLRGRPRFLFSPVMGVSIYSVRISDVRRGPGVGWGAVGSR